LFLSISSSLRVSTIPEFFEDLFVFSDHSQNCIRRSRGHGGVLRFQNLRFRFDVKKIVELSFLIKSLPELANWNFEESVVFD